MENKYVQKFETENFSIGSFDVYQDKAEELIMESSNKTSEEALEILKSMPTTYRASILDKEGNYVGYIGLYNVDAKNNSASIRIEVNKELFIDEQNEIEEAFKNWMADSLNITSVEERICIEPSTVGITGYTVEPKVNIVLNKSHLQPGVSEKDLEYFSKDYTVPKMQMPFTIKVKDRAIGIIGLSNVIWSNKRANLNLFLDKALGDDIVSSLSSYIIDDYINYVHQSNIHNVTLSVAGSDKNKLDIIAGTSLNYYGFIPFGVVSGNNIESNMMFQHIPNMKKENGIYIPDNISKDKTIFDTDKKELSDVIELGDGYRLIRPSKLDQIAIDINSIIDGHIDALTDRDNFSIPLGEDKYIIQKGNGNYGISKAVMNYSYVLLNNDNKYAGYINILRNNAENRNAEIEVGIDPKLQGNGLGKRVVNAFYDELFSIGYASVTSAVFEFNDRSLKLHEKVAELNGVRLESYYVNGRLWNMNFYSKINNERSNENGRHI